MTADAIVAVTGDFNPGTAYAAVTPAGANNAPANPGPNYLGTIDLRTGTVSLPPSAARRSSRTVCSLSLARTVVTEHFHVTVPFSELLTQ
jgi:hypothetical protein